MQIMVARRSHRYGLDGLSRAVKLALSIDCPAGLGQEKCFITMAALAYACRIVIFSSLV
jgi:hypothetical protein